MVPVQTARVFSILLLMLLVPKAIAQEDQAPQPVLVPDAADDVKLVTNGVPPQDVTATGQADDVDIRSVRFGDETEKDFTITLQMKVLPAQNSGTLFRAVYFELDGVKYRAIVAGRGGQGQMMGQGSLQSYDDGVQRFRAVGSLPTKQDTSSATITFTVPRDLVTNKQHVPIRHGDHLMNIYASASKFIAGIGFLPTGDPTGGVTLVDRAPDAAYGGHFLFVKGRVGQGSLMLTAAEPVRVSNGESTTIVYKVEAMNHGDKEESFQLELADLLPEWTVRVPSILRVGAQSSLVFPVILSMPDTHKHGETALFEVKATSVTQKDAWSSVKLGVYWTETPQPAGHHPKMWLHSSPGDFGQDPAGAFGTAFPFRSTWMNPLMDEVDPDADDANVPAFFNNELSRFVFSPLMGGSGQTPSGTEWTTEWFFPLAPQLLIGLDFDVAGAGMLDHIAVKHAARAQSSKLMVQLLYCDPDKKSQARNQANCTSSQITDRWSVIASGTSLATSADVNEVVPYQVPLRVDAVADYLPYKHGANVGLRLVLITDLPANTVAAPPRPELVIKSGDHAELTLPLIEYHDPVDQAFEAVGNLGLTSLVPFEKKVNPGKTTVFRFKLENRGSEPEEVKLDIQGYNREWARIVGDAQFKIVAHGSKEIELPVTVPESAVEGMRAELFLVSESVKDPAVVAAIRMRATVVQSEDIADESASAAKDVHHGVPGPELALGLIAAMGVAFVVRRRRL